MAAPVLLFNSDMKKNKRTSSPPKESEILVDMKIMRAFRAELLSQLSATNTRLDGINAKIDSVDASLNAKIDSIEVKIDDAVAQMNTMFHKALIIFEEQNLRNKQAYDAAAVSYEAIQDLKLRIKPECLES